MAARYLKLPKLAHKVTEIDGSVAAAIAHSMRSRGRRRGRAIGLLGGSFNPPHEGHLHISRLALKRLGLDEIWWLVSPQNPLKPSAGMAPFEDRLAGCRKVARDRRIRVSGIEAEFGTAFTAETIRRLKHRFPRHRFVWIMGADNLRQIVAWQGWTRIFHAVPIAVFARPTYCLKSLADKAANRFAGSRLSERASRRLVGCKPPAWVFLSGPLNPASATAIRAQRNSSRLVRGRDAVGRKTTVNMGATTKG